MSGIKTNSYAFKKYVCAQLKWTMKEYSIDLKDVSKETGISRSLLDRYISGYQLPSLSNALNICWYLGIDIDDIYDPDLFEKIERY